MNKLFIPIKYSYELIIIVIFLKNRLYNKMSIDPLDKIYDAPQFEPFIRKIVFTNFKNIRKLEELIFDYPITALVGQNGTNKTSALVALYGSVNKKTAADFWFTTPLDHSITKEKEYSSYYYTYKDGTNEAEVLLVNNQKKNRTIDYWETSRPSSKFGMNTSIADIESENKVKTRWSKIKKNVVYINFRSELSAFDRCLYHANKPSKNYKTKQEYIRSKSGNLKYAIENKTTIKTLYKKNKIINNIKLSEDAINIISKILNKKYISIQYIEHTFFNVIGGTVYLKTEDKLNYSEAYAGSGEFAVVSLVLKVISAEQNSLILLDEPEVSLHPNAQKKLMIFLVDQVKKFKHQIVMSTHSPEIIECLPNKAIKLFQEDFNSHKINIINNVDKYSVFDNIGKTYNKIPIYVEDKLSQSVIEIAIRGHNNLECAYQVKYYPGGANALINRFITMSETDNTQCLILLDGDLMSEAYKNRNNSFPCDEDLSSKILSKTINELFFNLTFPHDTNSTSILSQKKFINDAKKHISYLPFDSPEYFILDKNKLCSSELNNNQAKDLFKKITKEAIGDDCSDSIFFMQRLYLNKINEDCPEFKKIRNMLKFYLKNNTIDNWQSVEVTLNEKD